MANSPSRSSRTGYHHGDLRVTLLKGGVALLERVGVEAFSLREAARAAGVSPSAPYRHFPDRAALLRAIAASGARRVAERLSSGSPDAREATRRLERFAQEQPMWWEVITAFPVGDEGELERARGELLLELVGAVERSQPNLGAEEAIRVALGLWSGVAGVVQLRRGGALALVGDGVSPDAAWLAARLLPPTRP